ncbi:MAG: hypothetical protein MUE68_09895 [Bacteroidetes bacterium]|jgi:hypothetical protein|nr:hypothetical protein [Bacteroidota bacterium]
MRPLASSLLALFLIACDTTESTDRLADTYVDLLRYRDRAAQSDTSAIRAGIDSILSTHGYTPDGYRSAFASLADDPSDLAAFFSRAESRMSATNPALATPR